MGWTGKTLPLPVYRHTQSCYAPCSAGRRPEPRIIRIEAFRSLPLPPDQRTTVRRVRPRLLSSSSYPICHLTCIVWLTVRTIKGYMGSRGIAPLILNFGTRWRWVVNLTLQPLDPPGTHWKVGCVGPRRSWWREKSVADTGIRSLDRPVCSVNKSVH